MVRGVCISSYGWSLYSQKDVEDLGEGPLVNHFQYRPFLFHDYFHNLRQLPQQFDRQLQRFRPRFQLVHRLVYNYQKLET